jgi:hypothetical protein
VAQLAWKSFSPSSTDACDAAPAVSATAVDELTRA